ncbi:S-adenosyl-L-methionine-dependent methyltransferase, partial [Gautieria morchelliformis]
MNPEPADMAVSAQKKKQLRTPHARPCQRQRLSTLMDTAILQCVCTPGAPPPAGYLLEYLLLDMRILDVGCGPGTVTADIASLAPKGHVTGLEYAPEVLTQARSTAAHRGFTNIEFVVGDVNGLDFHDGTFDLVHAHQVLVHVGDPVQALREMRRVAKPGCCPRL